jgi:hypothetical protein
MIYGFKARFNNISYLFHRRRIGFRRFPEESGEENNPDNPENPV